MQRGSLVQLAVKMKTFCRQQSDNNGYNYRDVAWHILTTVAAQALDHASSCRHAMLHCQSPTAVHCSSTSSQSVHRCRSSLSVAVSLTLAITEENPIEKLQLMFSALKMLHINCIKLK